MNDLQAWKIRGAELLEKATLRENYDGPVSSPTGIGSEANGYSGSVEDFVDAWFSAYGSFEDLPDRVFACRVVPVFGNLNADDIIQEAMENSEMNSDYDPFVDGEKELHEAIERFKETNKELVVWHENTKEAVRVERPAEQGEC